MDRQMTIGDVAQFLGVKPQTVYSYHYRGMLPDPDGQVGRTKWWWYSTIAQWAGARRGQGWRKGK